MGIEQNLSNNEEEKITTNKSVLVGVASEEDKQITIKKIFKKMGLFIFLFLLFLIVVMFLTSGLSGLKEMLPVFLYIIPFLLFIFLIAGFISYKTRNNKDLTKKILLIQNPLIMTILNGLGVSLDRSNPKEFYFYYNLLFGIFLVVSGFILFFTSNSYKIALIPFGFGIITIIREVVKRK